MMREEAWLEVIEEAVSPLRYGASQKLLNGSLCGLERKKPRKASAVEIWMGGLTMVR